MRNVEIREYMYGYVAEDYSEYGSNNIKVFVPELFLDKPSNTIVETKITKGTESVFKNSTPPALLQYVSSKNYITLPTINNVNMSLKKDDRVIILFINKEPRNGIVIGRGW